MSKQHNEFLDSIEKLPEYTEFWEELTKATEEYWDNLVMSWSIDDIYEDIGLWEKKYGLNIRLRNAIKSYILYGGILRLAKVDKLMLPYIKWKVGKKLYALMWKKTYEYLKFIYNKAWQHELDKFLWKGTRKFVLNNELVLNSIQSRTRKLYLDVTTSLMKKLEYWIIKWIKEEKTKSQLVRDLLWSDNTTARNKSDLVLRTETEAWVEHSRLITAWMNGSEWKTWISVLDDRTSRVCTHTDTETIPIYGVFSSGVDCPPAHPNCRSTVEYTYDNYYDPKIKKTKKSKKYEFYSRIKWLNLIKWINRDFVWVWGNSRVWSDSGIQEYLLVLSKKNWESLDKDWLDTTVSKLKSVPKSSTVDIAQFKYYINMNWWIPLASRVEILSHSNQDIYFLMAKLWLSEIWFAQLINNLK